MTREGTWEVEINDGEERNIKKEAPWGFPGGPVVKMLCFHCMGHRFDPCSGS